MTALGLIVPTLEGAFFAKLASTAQAMARQNEYVLIVLASEDDAGQETSEFALAPLVRSFTLPGDLVLDPFTGSGSTCAAALLTDRRYFGIELDAEFHETASQRLDRVKERIAKRSSPVLIPTSR